MLQDSGVGFDAIQGQKKGKWYGCIVEHEREEKEMVHTMVALGNQRGLCFVQHTQNMLQRVFVTTDV